MAEPRNPKNAPGPFYVVKDACIHCGAPEAEAPGLVTLDDDEGCYFHKQPETSDETNAAIRAIFTSCIGVYRYGGTDVTIRRRLAELGHASECDHPLEGYGPVLRNHVRFTLLDRNDATEVAKVLLATFRSRTIDGRCTRDVDGAAHRADFEWTSSAKYATPRTYVVERVRASSGDASPYRPVSAASAWLMIIETEKYTPIGMHDALLEIGAVGIRWFSAAEWNGGGAGQDLPY
jgi:hypothetical protein